LQLNISYHIIISLLHVVGSFNEIGTVFLLNYGQHVKETPVVSFQFMRPYFRLVLTRTTCLSLDLMIATDNTITEPQTDSQNTRG